MFSKKLEEKLKNLAIGDSLILTDEDNVRWVFVRNARVGEEKKSWYEVVVTFNYDQESNSGETYNLDNKIESIEDLFEVFNAPFEWQWRNVGGAIENPHFW